LLTFEQIKELIEIVAKNRLLRLEIERSGFSLRIDGRDAGAGEPRVAAPAARPLGAEAPPPAVFTPEAEEAATEAEPEAPSVGQHVLHSPIVGTFYVASSPDADPYVQPGDRVKKGQVLCIVEAMKLMNEIESDVDGVLREIYPKNAQPVEFGEPLFAIETA
jgi:acetyl-CoA carboxylase biotin carboxyl carrier protein